MIERAAPHPRTAVAAFLARVDGDRRVALRELAAGGAPADRALTWQEWGAESWRFAAALVEAGCAEGNAVAILAGNALPWPVADVGALLARGVGVGIYPTSAPPQVAHVLADCRARVVVVDTIDQLEKVLAVRAGLPSLRAIVCRDASDAPGEGVWSWRAWLARGERALRRDAIAAEVDRRAAACAPDDLALLIYTSGSTGEPKGARITQRGLVASAASVRDTLGLTADDTTLSFLPFCHAGERIFGLYTRILVGMEAALVADPARVWDAAHAFGPTLFGGLPRFYEKAYETLLHEQAAARGEARERWRRTLDLGRVRSRFRQVGDPVPAELEAAWLEAGADLVARARGLFGGRVRLATSGGAALPPEAAEFLDALGVTVLGAYGLTEHLCACFHRPGAYDFHTVGPPMPGTELRIADDGEILARRCALTFDGYHGRADATAEAFTPDGEWLRTGDLGALDGRAFLTVTGRKKELIALSTGKKVAPLPIEARLAADPWIAHAMLYGEGRKFISALVSLRRPVVEAWAQERGLDLPYEALLAHPEVQARVRAAVDAVNAGLSRSERVKHFVVMEREPSAERGELTATFKVRRPALAECYRDRLEALYQ
jgi:long-chain acyl-CoA synthetase